MSSSVRSGDIIFATSVVDPSGETIEYEVLSGVGNSYITGTPDLFDMYTESKGKKGMNCSHPWFEVWLPGQFRLFLHLLPCSISDGLELFAVTAQNPRTTFTYNWRVAFISLNALIVEQCHCCVLCLTLLYIDCSTLFLFRCLHVAPRTTHYAKYLKSNGV